MIAKILVAAVLAAAPLSASAQVIIGNYPPTNDLTQTAAITDLRQKGMRFSMGAASAGVGELVMRLRGYDLAGEVIAEIRDSSGITTTPGATTLLTFSAPAPGGAAITDYVFTPSGSLTLNAGTEYWLVVRGIAGGTFDWMGSSPGITPTGMATFGSSSFSANGTTWANSTILSTFELRVVPGPAGSLLLMSAMALCGARRRR